MWEQKSFDNEQDKGILYLVPTPIGNLEDMSYRAVRIMKEADYIAAEDTRNTRKLCNHFEIDTPIVSYHEHNRLVSGAKLVEKLKAGAKITLVSDAGMPTISDPGYELVVEAIHEKIAVVPLPGANAALTSLIASGIETQPFYFYGFLSRQKKDRKKELEQLKSQKVTLIFYESPHRLKETLQQIEEILGERKITLCRELTKRYEEFIRGNTSEMVQWAVEGEVRGEFCIIIEGNKQEEVEEDSWWVSITIPQHVDHYITVKGLTSKDALKQVAKDRNMQKREVYQAYHIEE